jgi:isopentenyldiphosphate isomerase
LLSPQRAEWLAQQLGDSELLSGSPQRAPELVWHADRVSELERSEQLQNTLLQARDAGLLTGWRDERFSFWHSDCTVPDPAQAPLLRVERSGFRFLGMLSHAVHANGFMPDGRLWCARRALSKATDPGLLDNVTAGGLPSGETVQVCLQRELAEEAGLFGVQGQHLQAAGRVRTARQEPQGWHDEIVHVFNLTLQPGFVPMNQDGEVAEFMCLAAPEVLARIQAGEFTVDAVQTLSMGLQRLQGLPAGASAINPG